MLKTSKKKGFTLIELAVVVSIILILAVILIPKATAQRAASKDLSVSVTNINKVDSALEGYFSQSQSWATDGTAANVAAALKAYDPTVANVINKSGAAIVVIPVATTTAALPTVGVAPVEVYTSSVTMASGTGNAGAAAVSAVTGSIVVRSYTDGLIIYGVDHNGNVVNPRVIQ